jgi:hypothetical protein
VLDAEEVVDDFEPLGPRGVVGSADVHHTLVLRVRVVAEEVDDVDDGRGRDVERELILVHGRLLDEFGERRHEERAKLLQLGREREEVVVGVPACGLDERRDPAIWCWWAAREQ